MRRFLATAPPWQTTALWALVTVALLTVTNGTQDDNSWLVALASACIAAAIAAPFIWYGERRQRRETAYVTGPLTRSEEWAVSRAAGTGVPPADPALHRPALDLARHRLVEAIRQRTGIAATISIGLAVSVVFAVTDRSLWFAAGAVLLAGLLVRTLGYPSRQRRRLARLEQATTSSGW
ncbi:MAG TPA: hypothetical protein VFH38_00530 [Jatrophihabitans sp.]|nr:hypothetical protein [Jatrophihabitans sp.]